MGPRDMNSPEYSLAGSWDNWKEFTDFMPFCARKLTFLRTQKCAGLQAMSSSRFSGAGNGSSDIALGRTPHVLRGLRISTERIGMLKSRQVVVGCAWIGTLARNVSSGNS